MNDRRQLCHAATLKRDILCFCVHNILPRRVGEKIQHFWEISTLRIIYEISPRKAKLTQNRAKTRQFYCVVFCQFRKIQIIANKVRERERERNRERKCWNCIWNSYPITIGVKGRKEGISSFSDPKDFQLGCKVHSDLATSMLHSNLIIGSFGNYHNISKLA